MKTFHEEIRLFINLKKFSNQYRLCWIPKSECYSVMDIFDDELEKIDSNKIEILIH